MVCRLAVPLILASGYGSQTSDILWWPKYNTFELSGLNYGYWTCLCKTWFQKRHMEIKTHQAGLKTAKRWHQCMVYDLLQSKLFNQPIAPLLSLSSILSFSHLVYLCQLLVEGIYEYSSQTYFSSKIACISPLPTTFLCHIICSLSHTHVLSKNHQWSNGVPIQMNGDMCPFCQQ